MTRVERVSFPVEVNPSNPTSHTSSTAIDSRQIPAQRLKTYIAIGATEELAAEVDFKIAHRSCVLGGFI
jgi:hypothetical protein